MANLKQQSAEELMNVYQTAHPDEAYSAFNELYYRYSQRVFYFIQSKIKNQANTEDVMQKVFIKIHESKHQYNSKFKFEQWLFVIARSQVLDFFRAEKRYSERIKNAETTEAASIESDLTVFNKLDESQRELLELKYIDDLSYQEISKLVNKSEVSLRKSLSRMISGLKKGEAL